MKAAVRFRAVSKAFGNKPVLQKLELDIFGGQLTALAGANGSGKSTLLAVAAGLVAIDEGQIYIFEQSLDEYLDHPKYRIGFVSEIIEFDPFLTMEDLIEQQRLLAPGWEDARARELARRFNLDLRGKWSDGSRGQKMQFTLILTLCSRPDLLFVDEITAVLDASVRKLAVDEIHAFTQAGGCAIVATNILTDVQSVADRILFMGPKGLLADRLPKNIGHGWSKLRVHPQSALAIPDTVEHSMLRQNSDGSVSVLIKGSAPPGLGEVDQRILTAEELFIHFSRKGA